MAAFDLNRYRLADPADVPSPSLLVYPELIRDNIRKMLALVGGAASKLRPHVKTHKMPGVAALLDEQGIDKHKCATIAEAEMLAECGARDVLLAYQPVGPNIERLVRLIEAYPETTFRAAVDDVAVARAISEAMGRVGRVLPTLVDLDVGMGRTGIDPDRAGELYAEIDLLHHVQTDGLHAYDGHLKAADPDERRARARPIIERVEALRDELLGRGLMVPRIVMGGTPGFPIYAGLDMPGLEVSPGTCVLQDAGYTRMLPDQDFVPAAVLFGRVISRPRSGRLCLDIGTKAVASDPAKDRVTLLNVPDATLGSHNEEHLVVETPEADAFPPGTPVYAVPEHICPTCALHQWALVVENGQVVDCWDVRARDRVLTV